MKVRSMANTNLNTSEDRDRPYDVLDRGLDAALAKYSSAEPRTGLEDRILANLRAQQARPVRRAWWRWSLAAGFAAAVIMVAALVWRSERKTAPVISNHAPVTVPNPEKTNAIDATRIPAPDRTVKQALSLRAAKHAAPASKEVAANPKLDQFPSPYPLTEQERLLAIYVSQFKDEAVMVAEARAEELRAERERELKEEVAGTNHDVQAR
jgi:hypothetical protein